MGRDPAGIPDAVVIESVSSSVKPLGKKQDLSTLMARPEKASKSRRTWSTPCTELSVPSVKISKSSAKHKWVRFDSWQFGW